MKKILGIALAIIGALLLFGECESFLTAVIMKVGALALFCIASALVPESKAARV